MDTETLINFDEYFESPKASSETIFDEILSKKISLESILIKMEVYLTSKDNQKRSKAVKFITDFIKRASPGYLNPAEIDHLGVYLSSKLDDHYTVSTAALPGLNSLLQLADITTKRALDIIRTSVREIHVQSMMQADRNLVFSMCRFGLSRPDIVAEMHEQKYDTDFVFGFIQAMDGEKDPRNLLVSFECVRLIGEQLDLGPFCDEMFEVFACYFPIDFTPPKEDNLSITKQDLIVSLRRCFASNAKFAKSTVQLLLDKLNSNVDDAHLDSLEVYTECSKTYDPNDYKEYIEPIWALFHRLAMNTTKSSIEEAALTAIHAMAASLSRCLQTGGPVSIEWFVSKSVDSCLGYLNEPDLKLVWPNVRCLQSVASASSTANLLVLKKVLPAVIEHYQTSSQQSQKKTYLEILWQFVSSSLQFDKKPSGVLKDNLAKLLEICIESEPTKNLRQQSLIGFHTLLSFENLISDYEPIVKCLWHSIWVNSSGSEEEKKKVVEIFHVLSKKDEKLNEELLKSLSESTAAESSNYQNSYKIIEHLAQLNQNEQSQATFNKRIIEIFQSHILNAEANFKADYLISLFESLNTVITKSNDLSDNMELFGRLIEKLIDSCLLGDRNSSFSNSRVIIKLSLLVKSFSLKLKKSEFSLGFLQRVENLFTNEDYLKQFDIDEQKLKLNILMQVVSSLDKLEFVSEVERIFGKVEKYLKRFAIEDENEDVNLLGCRFLASFVNKLPNVDEYVENLRKSLEIEIEQNKSLKCLNLWIWITKALVLREHKLFEGFTTKIIDWLDDVKLSKMSSSAFGAILNDNPNENLVMTSKTSSNIKLFHKQRFFNFVIEPLKLNFASQEQNKKEQRMFYATSVLSMISPLPKEVLQRHLKSMLPLLLYSLSDTNELDESVCLSSLRSFDLVVRETSSDQEFLFTYTSEILSKLFAMCSYERSMEIRLLALTCVNNLATSLPPDRLIKHQKWVCRELDQSLNDHKRLCRQMAVQARNRWFLLSTKNNEH